MAASIAIAMNHLMQPLYGRLADDPQFQELMSGIRAAEENHASRIRSAVRELVDTLREKTGADCGRGDEIGNAMRDACELLDSRISSAEDDWSRQREWLAAEIDSVEVCRNPTETCQEIARAEVAV